jgi:ribonuclease HI
MYTDGSCLGNPGPGGWAAKYEGLFEISGGTKDTTNNIMELTAVVKGLEKCVDHGLTEVSVHTDSKYTMNGITTWIHGWKKKGWKTAAGKPVKNKELWVQLDALVGKFKNVEWHWVKAHAGNPQNEWVDTEARRCATLEQSG